MVAGHSETAPSSAARQYERLKVCERMHWTFEQYDKASAGDIAFAGKIWEIEASVRASGKR